MAGVYISFPFCAQKCSFCNFASGVFPASLEADYVEALVREIAGQTWTWAPETLYIGGGTPSKMPVEALARIVDRVPGRPWREATIEAAPGSFTADAVRAWRKAGINRVSLGVQSFVKQELARTGRRHDAAIVESDCRLLRMHGVENFNIDLIAGLPFQTPDSWRESLDWIEKLQPPHVSVYMFEVDEDSRLGMEVLNKGNRYGASSVPDDDQAAELYETAVERLERIGVQRYEISNFAAPGMESFHNLKYWRMEPYIGFGADAHSFDGQNRHANVETASDYVDRWRRETSFRQDSTAAQVEDERLFLGLRLRTGVQPTTRDWARFSEPIQRHVDAGLLVRDDNTLRLTSRGVLLSNEVFQDFLTQ